MGQERDGVSEIEGEGEKGMMMRWQQLPPNEPLSETTLTGGSLRQVQCERWKY